jgi:hypothetical protein
MFRSLIMYSISGALIPLLHLLGGVLAKFIDEEREDQTKNL